MESISTKDKINNFIFKIFKLHYILLKLHILIVLFVFALATKFLRQILEASLRCVDYVANLGSDNIDEKIIKLLETIKNISSSLKIFFEKYLDKR